ARRDDRRRRAAGRPGRALGAWDLRRRAAERPAGPRLGRARALRDARPPGLLHPPVPGRGLVRGGRASGRDAAPGAQDVRSGAALASLPAGPRSAAGAHPGSALPPLPRKRRRARCDLRRLEGPRGPTGKRIGLLLVIALGMVPALLLFGLIAFRLAGFALLVLVLLLFAPVML